MRVDYNRRREQDFSDGFTRGLKHRELIDICETYQQENELTNDQMARELFTYRKDYELFKRKANTKPITLENICAIQRLTGKKILNI